MLTRLRYRRDGQTDRRTDGQTAFQLYQDTRSCVSGQGSRVAHKCLIKTHGRVSAAKEVVWHTSVLFTGSRHTVVCQRPRKSCGTQVSYFKTHGRVSAAKEVVWHTSVLFQDTRSCVSGQGSRVAHKCLIYRNR